MALKILFINQPGSEYMQSQLYYGLRMLGNQVHDYPYNYTFHFDKLKDCDLQCEKGPCSNPISRIGCRQHSGHLTFERDDDFWGDCDLVITNSGWGHEALYQKLKDKPIIALDCGDSPISNYDAWVKCLGKKPELFCRREVMYGTTAECYQLGFSFYDDRKIFRPFKDLKYNLACMFRPTNPMREKVINAIQKIPNTFVGTLPYPEYLDVISRSKFVLDFPGAANTCVRTTEIAGRGSVIVRPYSNTFQRYDFTDHNSILFLRNHYLNGCFDDMVEQINFFINDENAYKSLRLSSWANFNAYHTCTARCIDLLSQLGF